MKALKKGLKAAAGAVGVDLEKQAIEKLTEEVWEMMPGWLKCICCCGTPVDKIKRINGCCGCFIPTEAKPHVEKLLDMLDSYSTKESEV